MKVLGLLLAAVLVLSVGGYVFAAGLESANITKTAVIGENVQMEVQPPLKVVTKWMGITIDWQENQTNPIYPNQTIGEGEITIINVSPIPQAAYLSAHPISLGGDIAPRLEVIARATEGTIFQPWQQIILAPGQTIDLRIEVKVSYGSPASSPFKGVFLKVTARPPQTERG